MQYKPIPLLEAIHVSFVEPAIRWADVAIGKGRIDVATTTQVPRTISA